MEPVRIRELEPTGTNKYIREVLRTIEAPPAITVRYFYTSPLAIDDPLSPLPPPATSASATYKQPPRPFSDFDDKALDEAWLQLRKKILKWNEEGKGEKRGSASKYASKRSSRADLGQRKTTRARELAKNVQSRSISATAGRSGASMQRMRNIGEERPSSSKGSGSGVDGGQELVSRSLSSSSGSKKPGQTLEGFLEADSPTTSGTPFIRAPSRSNVATLSRNEQKARPAPQQLDSYVWDDEEEESHGVQPAQPSTPDLEENELPVPSAKVPVGVSRLHNVVMDDEPVRMEPIYWTPVNDVAAVVRGTWFYKDTMLPVEVDVANMLELGYIELKPWTDTWRDELNSAVEVGAIGEMKILHRLWPQSPPRKSLDSRPGTSRGGELLSTTQSLPDPEENTPEKLRLELLGHASDLIDISTGVEGPDNKASGLAPYGRDGTTKLYLQAGVLYASEIDAYILRPKLQPSDYYGRRPLANYIRKGHDIGIAVRRGFDKAVWDKLHPPKKSPTLDKARQGVSTAQSGVSPEARQREDQAIAQSLRPRVSDLILVIHGIGQKLSERMESFHFTHAINAFRREINVELGENAVKPHLRKDLGGVMVLPVNWRHNLSFEDGGYRSDNDNPAQNNYQLKDITPESLPHVRNIISDVMLDIPYYLSREHNPKVLAACIREANRVYRLWCANNPGFSEWGRVHIIGHSLGSVMSVDVLSKQPSRVPPHLGSPSTPDSEIPNTHFAFDTKSLFLCGSPAGFFLLLKHAALLPRRDRDKPGGDSGTLPGVAGEQDTYGCLAVDNIYNIINPYDPVAYRINAAVDATYSASLKQAWVPTATSSVFRNPFKSNPSSNTSPFARRPSLPSARLPSNVELETHNFTREEIAEKRMYLLNDNGQIDFFMKYGGGAFDIQYLTMLSAHSSYWITKDFVRMITVEVGRPFGREGTVAAMRAVKKPIRNGP